ncbi:MAG: NADH-ubiquinone oxidoreductase-F iron-sulfur binding region domain-containing protein [Halobacteriota archaeon]
MSVTGAKFGPTIRVSSDTADRHAAFEAVERVATDDAIAVLPVGPTGSPEPLCLCTIDGTTAFHTGPTPERAADLAASLADGDVPTENADAVVDHDPATEALPVPDSGPLSVGRRRVLGPCGWVDPTEKPTPATGTVDPTAIRSRVAAVDVRGRGRADGARDVSIADLWGRARDAEGDSILIVHAADTDAPADELLCRGAAGHVLDAASIVADAVGATDVVAFASEGASEVLGAVESDVTIHTAPETFRVGEPTMALEALEGNDRIEARRRPPGPETWGLYGRPTVIHTPRTLLQIRALLADDSGGATGTRLLTVRGAVSSPATVELREDQPLSVALEAVETDGDRYVVGGRFGGLTETLGVPASPPALEAANLGTEGVLEVLGPGDCVVATAGERAAFAREENCGRCVPCREGSKQLHIALRGVYDGDFDGDGLRTLARVMRTTSLCAFGEAAAQPVRTALDAFEPEFRAHAEGRCPAGVCEGLE